MVDFKRMQMIMQEAIQLVEQIAVDAFESVNREWKTFEPILYQSSTLMNLDHVMQQLRTFLLKARNSLVLWSNQVLTTHLNLLFCLKSLKLRLASLLSSVLKIERISNGLIAYVDLCQKVSMASRSRMSMSASQEELDQKLYDDHQQFKSNQIRMLTEHRSSFQTVARQFQVHERYIIFFKIAIE